MRGRYPTIGEPSSQFAAGFRLHGTSFIAPSRPDDVWTATDSSEVEVAPAQSARGAETLVGALAALAELEYRLGAWQTAYVTALERLRAATAAGLEQETMFGLASVAMLEAGMGKADACRSHVDRALELSRQRDDRPVEAAAAEALGRLELGLGRVDEAIAWLRRASHLCDEHPDARSVAVSWPEDLADACIRRGDRVGARHAVNRLEQCVDRSGGCALAAAWARSHALVASDDRYERFFEDALAWSARAQQPFDTARTQLCFGERLRRMHRRRDAREQLCAAIETFDALGAQPWAERARHELAHVAASCSERSGLS
jgi:tetratricopeptide (TPR) repeat protein